MRILVAALVVVLGMGAAGAQEGTTVEGLLKEGYGIVGVMPSSAGPGILLQKQTALVMCFVAETPGSAEILTQYCKPVR
jgi:hypothetical protein